MIPKICLLWRTDALKVNLSVLDVATRPMRILMQRVILYFVAHLVMNVRFYSQFCHIIHLKETPYLSFHIFFCIISTKGLL